jgi:hypothetical protein
VSGYYCPKRYGQTRLLNIKGMRQIDDVLTDVAFRFQTGRDIDSGIGYRAGH